MPKSSFQIAIDGPVAAGKGTISKLLADRLGFLYVDTGAMYRVATLVAQRAQLSFQELDRQEAAVVDKLVELLNQSSIVMYRPQPGEQDGRLITVLLDDEDVSWAIREKSINLHVAVVAQIAAVRAVLVHKQQMIAEREDVVMEGRDITYRVLPEAQVKIYLDADLEVRARRRHEQILAQGKEVAFDKIVAETRERDKRDMERKTDPLKIVEGVWVLDTTTMSIAQVVEAIVRKVEEMRQDER